MATFRFHPSREFLDQMSEQFRDAEFILKCLGVLCKYNAQVTQYKSLRNGNLIITNKILAILLHLIWKKFCYLIKNRIKAVKIITSFIHNSTLSKRWRILCILMELNWILIPEWRTHEIKCHTMNINGSCIFSWIYIIKSFRAPIKW